MYIYICVYVHIYIYIYVGVTSLYRVLSYRALNK